MPLAMCVDTPSDRKPLGRSSKPTHLFRRSTFDGLTGSFVSAFFASLSSGAASCLASIASPPCPRVATTVTQGAGKQPRAAGLESTGRQLSRTSSPRGAVMSAVP